MTIARCKKGFRLDKKKNRCVRVRKKSKGNPSRSSKGYNPFKMWGSYVGAYFTPSIFVLIDEISIAPANALVKALFWFLTPGFFGTFSLALVTFGMMTIGFLIGWGIHSLIRRLRK